MALTCLFGNHKETIAVYGRAGGHLGKKEHPTTAAPPSVLRMKQVIQLTGRWFILPQPS